MFDIHDSIQDLPGSTPARRMLISKSLNYLDRLSNEAVGDKDWQREMATAYEKIASVQGNPFDANLGDARESIKSYQKAAAIWEVLARTNPPDPIDMLGLARTYRQLAGVVANTGGSDPVALALKAVDIGERLKDVASSDPRVWEELERDREMAAAIQVKTGGDPGGALENLQKALQITAQPETDAIAAQSGPTRVALVEMNIGVSLAELGRFNEASEHFRMGVAKLQSEPKRPHLESTIALLQSRWGDILMMRGDTAQALTKYRLNRELLAPLAAADPRNVDLQVELGFAYARLGHALSQQRNENESLANLEKALVIFDSLVRQTGYSQGRGGLASSHNWIAQVLQSRGDITGAIQHYKQAQEQYLALSTAMPWDQYHQASVAGSHRVIGNAFLAMGQPKQAEQEYQHGIEIAEQLVTTRPGNVLAWCTLADLYFGFGEVSRFLALHARANLSTQRLNWLAARQYYRRSVDAWRHIPDPGVSTSPGFNCGSPTQVRQALAQADAAILHFQSSIPLNGL
jgi:tetratricopeptide (TPR) repeat protein